MKSSQNPKASPVWRPKTATGRKLLKLRKRFLAQGGEVLDANAIAEELRQLRGGLLNAGQIQAGGEKGTGAG
jgi:hypothetical protein